MPVDFVTNQDIILAARRNLSQNVWDYLTGGAESETTMRRNRFGLDSLAFRPRVLVMSPRSTRRRLSSGIGSKSPSCWRLSGPQGGVAVSKAAEEFGTINFVSSVTQASLEEIAAAGRNPKIFQLYVQGDLKWLEILLGRVRKAGYAALCLTVDTAHYGHRERRMMDRWFAAEPARFGL